ncbi:MAG: hypothetical protein M3065_03555 [Actinomycetota bacterium]|nr:hypothetical protein [Actinomycetota bacterium]
MDSDEATTLLPELLREVYPGKSRPARGDSIPDYPDAWLLEEDGALGFVKIASPQSPFIWIRVGAAIDIPRVDELAYFVACANKDLQAGRAYMRYGDQVALVAVDESISTAPLSQQSPESMQDVVTRLDFTLDHARTLQYWILQRYGGRPFSGDDWALLVPDDEETVLSPRPA